MDTVPKWHTPRWKQLYNRTQMRRYAMWTKPEFTEMRFGFEVTMYIYNR